jgi:kynureninase
LNTTIEYARQQDQNDPLARFREKFHIPTRPDGSEVIYLCGNSLGLQPKSTEQYVQQELDDWKKFGVEGHFEARRPWLPYHEFLNKGMAEIVGGLPEEVIVMNTLTVNLHLLMVSFYRPTKDRHKILIEANAFPSDRYAVRSQLSFHGYDPPEGLIEAGSENSDEPFPTEKFLDLLKKQGSEISMILLGGVNYYTGQAFKLREICEAAHEQGVVVGYDLAHAAGNIPLRLHDWGVDFAAWCNYKYINSGPGAPAGAFIHERHLGRKDLPRFHGWWGNDKAVRFKMSDRMQPFQTAEAWQLSNPPILAMAAVLASLDIFQEAGIANLREKSVKLTGYLEFMLSQIKTDQLRVITPKNPDERGCQLSLQLTHPSSRIMKALRERGVVCDWREPDVIRIAPVPLYNTFEDVYKFVHNLTEILLV